VLGDGPAVEPDGSTEGSSLGPRDGSGVTSGLPWTTDGSGAVDAEGTVPSGPVPALQAAETATVATRIAIRRLSFVVVIGLGSSAGSSTLTIVLVGLGRIAVM
jgi:hypothetical protein